MNYKWLNIALAGAAVLVMVSCGGGGTGTASAPQAQAIAIAVGDAQTARPGAAVAVAPVVQVTDATGSALVDVPVTFAVTSGGGQVQAGSARTDAAGRATSGPWTLGPNAGIQTLSASVAGLPAVIFTAKAAAQSQDVTVNVESPSNHQTVDQDVLIVATVASTEQLASVVAKAGGRTVPMVLGPFGRFGSTAWGATLSLADMPRGNVGLVVTATDVSGHVTDVVLEANLDRRPTVTVARPAEGALARPRIELTASCSDDDGVGCMTLTASVNGTVLASDKEALEQVLDLTAYEGQTVNLVVVGTDSAGQTLTVTRSLYVESSAQLAVYAAVDGPVWDVSGTRILHLDLSAPVPALKILDNQAGSSQTLETSADLAGSTAFGYLTPGGALFVHLTDGTSPSATLFEWRTGTLSSLAQIDSAASLRVAGNWAVFSQGNQLWRRDLVAGVSALVSAAAGNWMNDVAATGDVVYWGTDYNIYRWRGGATIAVTSRATDGDWNLFPVIDGTNVVFQTATPSNRLCCSPTTYGIVLDDGTGQQILTSASERTEPRPGSDYVAAGGHVAYTAVDSTQELQVWRRGADGVHQLTSFGGSSRIDAILPDGTVFLSYGLQRYRARPGQPLQAIGSSLGRVVVREGTPWVIIDRTVLSIAP